MSHLISSNYFVRLLFENRFGILLALQLAACLMLVLLVFRLKAESLRYRVLARALSGPDAKDLLSNILTRVLELESTVSDVERRVDSGWAELLCSVKRVSIVRFNAFDGVGGNQSFSVALCDSQGNGLVLTGIHGREEFRLYAKPLQAWASAYPLSEEELQAVKAARHTQ